MDYQIEELSPVKRRVKVNAPVDEVTAALATTLAIYRSQVNMDGFRKGKVPASVVESRFRKQIVGEATNDLINYHINEVMSEIDVVPASPVHFEGDGEPMLVKGEPFEYAFWFEILPDFEMPDYEGMEVEEEAPAVDPAEIEAVIKRIRDNLAEVRPVEGAGPAVDGQIAVLSFVTLDNGAPIEGMGAQNFELELGKEQALPEFEELVKTLKVNESGETEVSFPSEFLNSELAGKTLTMRATIYAIKEKVMPEEGDELAQRAGGFPNMEAMREAVERSYVESRRQLNRSVAQKRLLDSLLKMVDFPLPETMVEEQIDRMIAELAGRLERQGRRLDSLGKTPEELRAEYRSQAEDTARSQVFLLRAALKEGLNVSEAEMEQFFQQMAMRMGEDYSQVRTYHEDNNLMVPVRDRLLADKAMETIYEKAEVKEVPAGHFASAESTPEETAEPSAKAPEDVSGDDTPAE